MIRLIATPLFCLLTACQPNSSRSSDAQKSTYPKLHQVTTDGENVSSEKLLYGLGRNEQGQIHIIIIGTQPQDRQDGFEEYKHYSVYDTQLFALSNNTFQYLDQLTTVGNINDNIDNCVDTSVCWHSLEFDGNSTVYFKFFSNNSLFYEVSFNLKRPVHFNSSGAEYEDYSEIF